MTRFIKYLIFLWLLSADLFSVSLPTEPLFYERTVEVLNKTLDFVLSDITSTNIDGIFAINMARGNKEKPFLNKAIGALNKTFDFVLDDYNAMIVDGIFGVTIARAHLIKALENVIDPNVRKNLLLLKEKADTIYALQYPNLKNFPWKYYVFNNYVLPTEVWLHDIEFSYGKLNPNPEVFTGPYNVSDLLDYARYVLKSTFNESFSDDCLVEVATASDNRNPHNCPVSKPCYDYMIKMPESYDPHFPGYGVTHMLLLLQIAKGRNCIFNEKEVDALIAEECSYILWELRKNVGFGYIPPLFDLFIEQTPKVLPSYALSSLVGVNTKSQFGFAVAFCGQEGFEEFLQKEYLEYILQEQNEYGGFGIKFVDWKELAKNQRVKRESKRMKYGANCHTVGLTALTLALFIRLLIKKPFRNKVFYEN